MTRGGRVTTGLLAAVRYLKDNRLLPRGFDKRTAPADCAVRGDAADDPDFQGGGDRVVYRVDVPPGAAGPLRIEVELLYQPIAFRWAHNLDRYAVGGRAGAVSFATSTRCRAVRRPRWPGPAPA